MAPAARQRFLSITGTEKNNYVEKKMSKISVIVPVYKAEEYLDECIQSVLAQTYSELELVLVDDGSPDKSGKICDEYAKKDSRIKVIHTENCGVCHARNTGIEASCGEYFTFLDSDDTLSESALKILLRDITDNDAQMAIAVVENTVLPQEEPSSKPDFVWEDTEALEKSIEDNPYTYSSCAKLYKRDFFEDVRFEEGRRIHEDSYFVFCCFLKKPRVSVRNFQVYKYRYNPDSASNARFSEKYFDILYFAKKKCEAVEKCFPELSDRAKNIDVKASLAMLHALCNTTNNKYNKCVRDCVHTVIKYRKSFIPAAPGDKKWFMIVRLHMYGLFKALYKIKYSSRID